MYKHLFLTFLALNLTLGAKLDLGKIYEDAEAKMEERLRIEMEAGSTSSRFNRKKFTDYSREMAKRNSIFKHIATNLEDNFAIEQDEARTLAKQALLENRKKHKKEHGAGGQGGHTKPVAITDDSCSGVDPQCDSSAQFRTINGNCNNLKRPYWGAMSTPFSREIPVGEYNPKSDITISDGTGVDGGDYTGRSDRRGHGKGGSKGGKHGGGSHHGGGGHHNGSGNHGSNGNSNGNGGSSGQSCPSRTNLPSARTISNQFHTGNDVPDTKVTHMVTQWGQFLDHDITLTPENEDHDCCTRAFNATDECFPITVSATDSFYSTKLVSCLEFSRSVAYCEENGGARQQVNGITSFVDASNVYGSDDDTAASLRSFVDGKLSVGENNLLPVGDDGNEAAGDVRALEMPGLATMHTLFVREHNRICDLIKAVRSDWTDEEIYLNARRILIAEYQSVVYGGYLPVVLGNQNLHGLSLDENGSSYKDDTNPAMTNEFATASYRFGHSMIQGIIQMFSTDNTGKVDEYPLSENFFSTEKYHYNAGQGMEQILMGLVTQPAQAFDKEVSSELTNLLFPEEGASFGNDLVARNIQRGRDHGLPGFCCYYKLYDDNKVDCDGDWSKKYRDFSTDAWNQLQSIYSKPSDIDLFTGGLAQGPHNGGLTGKVFNAMKANQFKRTKDGDRFFFTHKNEKGSFTKTARKTLINRTLAGIICDNTAMTAVPANVFLVTSPSDYINCEDTPSLGDISSLLQFD